MKAKPVMHFARSPRGRSRCGAGMKFLGYRQLPCNSTPNRNFVTCKRCLKIIGEKK